ncbi:MAG: hypothetical protein JRI97_02095 [Deltaproteobacteria bacterium]|nr:hypothetical protein [Deltaproteobacteria bacterium]
MMQDKEKARVAFFDFACCEGCQLEVARLGEDLLPLLRHVDIVSWRELSSRREEDYDVAFCEGSITTREDMDRVREIRDRAKILVALGSCACIPCHNSLKNQWPMAEVLDTVYGREGWRFDTIPAQPVAGVVCVDYEIRGCPVTGREFLKVCKAILTDQPYAPPEEPVCVECRLSDNLCVEKFDLCLGPVTRAGCGAACPRLGTACNGCRGAVPGAKLAPYKRKVWFMPREGALLLL